MYQTTKSALSQLKQLCPNQSSVAACLNQLRRAKIQFLNLGNIRPLAKVKTTSI